MALAPEAVDAPPHSTAAVASEEPAKSNLVGADANGGRQHYWMPWKVMQDKTKLALTCPVTKFGWTWSATAVFLDLTCI